MNGSARALAHSTFTSLAGFLFVFALPFGALAQPTVAWTRTFNGTLDGDARPVCLSVPRAPRNQALDPAGNLIVTGCRSTGVNVDFATYKIDRTSGAVLWSTTYNGSNNGNDWGLAVAVDAAGNVFATGLSADLGQSDNIRTIKYDGATGAILWSVGYDGGTNGMDVGQAIAVDANGHVVVTGVSAATDAGDMRTIKYDGATGAVLWTMTFAGSANSFDIGNAVAVDAAGHVIVAGSSSESGEASNIRTIKYNGATGAEMWNRSFNGSAGSTDEGRSVAIDAAGNVLVTGVSRDLGQGSNIRTIKYNGATGAEVWSKAYDGTSSADDEGFDVAVDASGNVVVTGSSTDSGQGSNMRTLKYFGANGALLWTMAHSGSANGDDAGRAVALDAAGNVVVTGTSADTGQGGNIRTIKYDGGTGAELWNVAHSGTANGDDSGYAVAVDGSGNVLVTGLSRDLIGGLNIRSLKYGGADGSVTWSASEGALPSFALVGNVPFGARTMAVDAAGHVVVTGLSVETGEGADIRTIKFDAATGAPLWSVSFSGSAHSSDVGNAVALDAAGNVFVAGYSVEAVGGFRFRTVKYDAATGAMLWTAAHAPAMSGVAMAKAIAVDAAGNAIITGFGPDASGRFTIRTIKYDGATGAELWISEYASPAGSSSVTAIAMDGAGNVIVAGSSTEAQGGTNIRTIKYDGTTGAQMWTAAYGGSGAGSRTAYAVAIDGNGHVVITGFSSESGQGVDIRTIKYHGGTGAELWNASYNGTGNGDDAGYALVLDANGNVFVTGNSNDGAQGFNTRTLKYDGASGVQLWTSVYNGSANGFDTGYSVALDVNGDVVVTGSSSDTGQGDNIRTIGYDGDTGAQLWTLEYAGGGGARDVGYGVAKGPGEALYLYGTSTEANRTSGLFVRKLIVPALPPATAKVRLDFNGDNKADLLWRNIDGSSAIWLMDGLAIVSSAQIFPAGTAWQVAHIADLNGDGKSDLVWQNPDGRITVYLMVGTNAVTKQQILPAGGGWTVTQAADLNGDGKADLVFQNADGTVAAWLMDGVSMTAGSTLLGAGSGWSVTKTGDFDGDGRADLVWTHTDGRVAIWLMDGLTVKSTNQILNAGTGWTVTHTADFNGDGKSDLVWQNVDGSIAIWLMNGAAMASGSGLLGAGTGWSVTRTGDFNGDGKADLFFLHNDGRAAIYLMNGLVPTQTTQILNAGGGWSAKRVQDMNGDGKADIVWENVDGSVAIWLMNGTSMLNGAGILGTGTGWSVSAASP